LAGDDRQAASRIRFFGQPQNFQELDRGILYYHGMNAEAQNSIYPKSVIIQHQFGLPLKRPILNEPFGSFLITGLVYRIKMHHNLVGRLTDYRSIFRNSAVHDWGWSLYVLATTVWVYIYHVFFALAHIRRKTKLKDMVQTVSQAVTNEGVDGYARKQLVLPEVKAVVLGHSHEWRQDQSEDGTYVNTGTWALMFRLVEPPLKTSWKRFRWLQRSWLCLKHFLLTRDASLAFQLTKMLAWIMATALLVIFFWQGFPNDGWFSGSFKWMADICLAFVFIAGLLRVLSVKSGVESIQRYPFCLTKIYPDDRFELRLMEYLPQVEDCGRRFRQCH
jgi:UDP-2,3-diacylglucosamine pyrophosphatase LpxH